MTHSAAPFGKATILGYPRIGRNRELKKSVEAFWAGKITEQQLEESATTLRAVSRENLANLGLDKGASAIVESFSFYDHVLDTAVTLGAVPHRFSDIADGTGNISLSDYFRLARGEGDKLPLEMTKWFDTNYHYLVPEIDENTRFSLRSDRLVTQFLEAQADGFVTRPSIVGPVTFLLLSKSSSSASADFCAIDRLADVLPVYVELLQELAKAGVEWLQLDESALVDDTIDVDSSTIRSALTTAYETLCNVESRPSLFVSTAYAQPGDLLSTLAATPVEAIGFDVVRGAVEELAKPEIAEHFSEKILVAGVIDGHNIWRGDLASAFGKLEKLSPLFPHITVSSSTSLIHVPHTLADEKSLGVLGNWLAFADEKVTQIVTLAEGLLSGVSAIQGEIDASARALTERSHADGVFVDSVRQRQAKLSAEDFTREDFVVREEAQKGALDLMIFPTTTIGSFPQTTAIRQARAKRAKGEITAAEYDAQMKQEIVDVVKLQEEIGLDVLVHGEPERNDMVQYFAEQLEGFAVTENGWVQSYGSRCTRPSILWGDVSRKAAMTVEWSRFAQSLTQKPMKGMLTGPVTILAWSFVRDDIALGDTAKQVALALRDEISELEEAGIRIIQVDEPALRELLPLKKAHHEQYLEWSVGSFRLATSGVKRETQIHTHLCYSEFGVIMDAIRGLDADVTSIEAARSRMDIVDDVHANGFDHGIGPGVYDIHSPRVPSVEELTGLLSRAADTIEHRKLWVNPDCGLKTRGYEETVVSLKNMIAATESVRKSRLSS